MTSEIKPEDVKLPEPVAYMTEHEQGPMLWLDRREALSYSDEETPPIELVPADQVRAAVLEERERILRLCREQIAIYDHKMEQALEMRDDPRYDRAEMFKEAVENIVNWINSGHDSIPGIEAIRAGHSVTETKRD